MIHLCLFLADDVATLWHGLSIRRMFSSKKKGRAPITGDAPEFNVRYVGKVQTFTASGQGCTQYPVQKIWDAAPEEKDMKRVLVTISPLGISLADTSAKKSHTQTMIDIKNISYCCAQKGLHETTFAWISKDDKSQRIDCHAVVCFTADTAKEMSLAMSQAFRVAYKTWKVDREKMARTQSSRSLTNPQIKDKDGLASDKHKHPNGSEACSISSDEFEYGDNNLDKSTAFASAVAEMNLIEESELSFTDNNITETLAN